MSWSARSPARALAIIGEGCASASSAMSWLSNAQCDEIRIEGHLAANPSLARAELSYWIRKLQARFLAGDYTSAVNAASRAQSLLWKARYAVEAAEYVFYGALSLAAVCDTSA